ncbi:non-homologous end-joining DNA ligase (plasmid) [Pseudomonas silesiensis]|uniref:non-homologous end-joining DNA ligase n=1 Tax=Pseudomonas silesiensis TaxID=1853130 RepID=UPI0030CCCD66
MPITKATSVQIPSRFPPQLATLATRPPHGKYFWEIKFDGYRMMARVHAGKVTLYTKNGADWTSKFKSVAAAVESLGLQDAWLDGELVAQNADGRPDFGALQEAISQKKTDELVLYVFDLMFYRKTDLRPRKLEFRRAKLKKLLSDHETEQVRISEDFDQPVDSLLSSACAMNLEGLIGKRAGSPYISGRSTDWLKLKCKNRQEFVIVGFTQSSTGLGSVLLASYDDAGALKYAGRVGSGFNARNLQSVHKALKPIVTETSALIDPGAVSVKHAVWVQPTLVCEAKFAEITRKGRIRHGVFVALRTDISPTEVSIETPIDPVN